MDRVKEVETIYHSHLNKKEKTRQLEDIALDIQNEMAAEDQNMHPDIRNKLAEGLRLAKDYLRELSS